MTDVRHVLVDTDVGVDDALALLTVLDAADTELIGVGSVFGNCTERQAASNALVVFAAAGRVDIPCLRRSATTPTGAGKVVTARRRRARRSRLPAAGRGFAGGGVGGRTDPPERS